MKTKKTISNILFTIAFPVVMFFVMWIIVSANGLTFVSTNLLVNLEVKTVVSTVMALAIYSQFRNGRFDFSGGAVLVLTSIIAGNVANKFCNDNLAVYFILCITCSLVLSLIVCTVYCFARVPIVIITIAMGLLYEAITRIIFDGRGVELGGTAIQAALGKSLTETIQNGGWFAGMYIPFILAVAIFIIFTYRTKWGKEASMLANNQKVTVNNGVNEIKNVYATYIVTGLIMGLGASIYCASTSPIKASGSSLDSVGTLFSYIVPVFMGMYFGSKSRDYIGIFVSSIGLAFFSFGMNMLAIKVPLINEGVTNIITGCFTLLIYSLGSITELFKKIKESQLLKKESDLGDA